MSHLVAHTSITTVYVKGLKPVMCSGHLNSFHSTDNEPSSAKSLINPLHFNLKEHLPHALVYFFYYIMCLPRLKKKNQFKAEQN